MGIEQRLNLVLQEVNDLKAQLSALYAQLVDEQKDKV